MRRRAVARRKVDADLRRGAPITAREWRRRLTMSEISMPPTKKSTNDGCDVIANDRICKSPQLLSPMRCVKMKNGDRSTTSTVSWKTLP